MPTYTPMIQQYLTIKSQYTDAFLFFRLGDFYEMFFEDAIEASQLLEITLTSRDASQGDRIPMCGIPHHSAANYIETLIQKGHKVAICEQVEDPKLVKGLVKREVVRVITPGTLTEGKNVDVQSNHFIGAVDQLTPTTYALAYLDLATGERHVQIIEGDESNLLAEIDALLMREVIVDEQLHLQLSPLVAQRALTLSVEERQEQSVVIDNVPEEVLGACTLLHSYVQNTQKLHLLHLQPFVFNQKSAHLSIDANSMRNLELVRSARTNGKEGSLFWLLDETVTAMGARKLKSWLHQPLADLQAIQKRGDVVAGFVEEFFLRQQIRDALRKVYDLERLAGRIAMGSVNGRDLAQLRDSLQHVPLIIDLLKESTISCIQHYAETINPCETTHDLLIHAIADHPPISVKEGGIIRTGFDEQLDIYRDALLNGKEWLAHLEQKERERTGIKNLKISYNRIFGYFIEVTKSNLHLVDSTRYERKQTLANAERYITDELKEKEVLILEAEEKGLAREYELFCTIREELKEHIPAVQEVASVLSALDVLVTFAVLAEKRQYIRPQFIEGIALTIENGRHPVVEKMMDQSLYVPNHCELKEQANMLLITGPNMSGKSTYMRQIALIVVMAQVGSFVPCDVAVLPITDQIFTRIGAADDLASGQSTFMMEMMESRYAIQNATERSLLLFDEIGRGTSTYDGMALAQAMMEYIHEEIGANTLFSTHYHELTSLDEQLTRLRNVHVAAIEKEGKVVFLHKVMAGAADKSYGIHVAELAGLPQQIVQRAEEILVQLEQEENIPPVQQVEEQMSFFEAIEKPVMSSTPSFVEELRQLDVLHTTPYDAFQLLMKWKQEMTSSGE